MSDGIKVTDEMARDWISRLSDDQKQELLNRALEKRAIELLQPKAAPPDFAHMTDSEFNLWKIHNGI